MPPLSPIPNEDPTPAPPHFQVFGCTRLPEFRSPSGLMLQECQTFFKAAFLSLKPTMSDLKTYYLRVRCVKIPTTGALWQSKLDTS